MEQVGSRTKFVDATNRFYTLIPHDFGMNKIKILDTDESVKAKVQMLDNLLEIEVAYSLLCSEDDRQSPIDSHYHKLKCDLQVGHNFLILTISITITLMFLYLSCFIHV